MAVQTVTLGVERCREAAVPGDLIGLCQVFGIPRVAEWFRICAVEMEQGRDMTNATKDASLLDAPTETALDVQPIGGGVALFERLARDPSVDVEKLERLIAMQERILDRNATGAFNAAFSEMQSAIPEISEKGQIRNKEGGVQSKYATNEDIQKVLRPILQAFGFSLSFRTEWPDKKTIKVIGILTHREGHARESEFLSDADTSGNKNSVQALGSAISYGRRYTTLDLLNITSRGQDDDGATADDHKKPPAPDGYEGWFIDMEAQADHGWAALSEAYNKSKPEYRNYTARQNAAAWAALKNRAGKVKATR